MMVELPHHFILLRVKETCPVIWMILRFGLKNRLCVVKCPALLGKIEGLRRVFLDPLVYGVPEDTVHVLVSHAPRRILGPLF